MAMSTTSSEYSMASSINSYTKLNNFYTFLIPIYKSLHFIPFSYSNSRILHLSCSSTSCSSVLEQNSTGLPLIQVDLIENPNNLNDTISGLLRNRQTEELAYGYFEKAKQNLEFRPETAMLSLLIRYLVRSKDWVLIMSVFDDLGRYKVLPYGYTISSLVRHCIVSRKFRIVNRFLEVVQFDHDSAILAFESAMKGYNKLHMYKCTVNVYRKMKSARLVPNPWCYAYIMEAHRRNGDNERVIVLFREFHSRKLDSPLQVSSRIYSIVIDSLAKSGRHAEALEYLRDTTKNGFLAENNSLVYSSLITSFARKGEVEMAEELFKEAEEKKMIRDPEVFLKLVLMYIEVDQVEKTIEIARAMKRVNIKVSDCVLCTIVNGYSKKRGFRAAIRVYEELVLEGFEPGQVTYASVINAHCRTGLYSKAETIFLEMEQKGFDKCVVAYSSMVSMYGKTGRLSDAMKLVAKMKAKGCEPNVWIYNALMDMHGRVKKLRQVEKIWNEMKRRKVVADKVSYTSVISAYNRAREYEMCIRYYDEYRMNGGSIDKAMGGIMVGIFSKLSRIDELVKLLNDMRAEGTALDARLYASAFNAFRDAGLQIQTKWLQENFQTDFL